MKMTEKEFNYLIGGLRNVMENHYPNDYQKYTCNAVRDIFGGKHPATTAYRKFVKPHLQRGSKVLDEHPLLWPELRILLLQAFEDEIRSTREWEKWPQRIKV